MTTTTRNVMVGVALAAAMSPVCQSPHHLTLTWGPGTFPPTIPMGSPQKKAVTPRWLDDHVGPPGGPTSCKPSAQAIPILEPVNLAAQPEPSPGGRPKTFIRFGGESEPWRECPDPAEDLNQPLPFVPSPSGE